MHLGENENSKVVYKGVTELLNNGNIQMENRSRRNNIRVVGIPEGDEAGDMVEIMSKLLQSVLGWEDSMKLPEIERWLSSTELDPNDF